tara:strand:+ start:2651 stop:3319 length:669 start_codon:yes stop_codon:yes gene_type:complete
MTFNFEYFKTMETKEVRKEYLSTLDKDQFKYKPFGTSYVMWRCPDTNCPHQSLNKANLFKHIAVPCKQIAQWSCPFNYWQEDMCLLGDFNLQYPDIYIEKLFKNYVIKKIADDPDQKDKIFKLFPLKVFADLWVRQKFSSFSRTIDKKVWIKDKHLLWVESKSPEGIKTVRNIIDKHILDFISKNIMGWANWHSGNMANMDIFYEFKTLILKDQEQPNIIEI